MSRCGARALPGGSPVDIATATGLSYSTVHRIVSVLVEQRYLKLLASRNVSLGPRLIELGFAAYWRLDLVQQARPFLEELSRQTRDTVRLARLEEGEVSYLDKPTGSRAVEISSRIGGRKPVISTGVGKALILDYSEAHLIDLYRSDHGLMTHPVPRDEWLQRMRDYRRGGLPSIWARMRPRSAAWPRRCAMPRDGSSPRFRCPRPPITWARRA